MTFQLAPYPLIGQLAWHTGASRTTDSDRQASPGLVFQTKADCVTCPCACMVVEGGHPLTGSVQKPGALAVQL